MRFYNPSSTIIAHSTNPTLRRQRRQVQMKITSVCGTPTTIRLRRKQYTTHSTQHHAHRISSHQQFVVPNDDDNDDDNDVQRRGANDAFTHVTFSVSCVCVTSFMLHYEKSTHTHITHTVSVCVYVDARMHRSGSSSLLRHQSHSCAVPKTASR